MTFLIITHLLLLNFAFLFHDTLIVLIPYNIMPHLTNKKWMSRGLINEPHSQDTWRKP